MKLNEVNSPFKKHRFITYNRKGSTKIFDLINELSKIIMEG